MSDDAIEKTYICKICRKPISMDFMSEKMMEFMDMPNDSGAHAECLGIKSKGSMRTTDLSQASSEKLREPME